MMPNGLGIGGDVEFVIGRESRTLRLGLTEAVKLHLCLKRSAANAEELSCARDIADAFGGDS
jgi:hypothetical protein